MLESDPSFEMLDDVVYVPWPNKTQCIALAPSRAGYTFLDLKSISTAKLL